MRILHTSDWHLGRTFHSQVLDDAHAAYADHLLEVVTESQIDAVLVAGDVYDRGIPPAAAVTLLDQTLRRLTERTRVIMTPGNHDSAQRLGFAADLMRERLVINARPQHLDRGIILPDAQGRPGAVVHALPYLDPDAARESLPPLLAQRLGEYAAEPKTGAKTGTKPEAGALGDDVGAKPAESSPALARLPRSHEAAVSGALRLVAADLERQRIGRAERLPAILMAHAFVVGGAASESEADIRVGGVDSVAAQTFTTMGGSPAAHSCGGLDYVALGHLHRPQELRRPDDLAGPRLVYSGSPIAFSFAEADVVKSSVIVELGPQGVTGLERIAVPVRHPVRDIAGTMAELLSPAFDDAVGAWVRVTLQGPRPPQALATLKTRFPGLLAFLHQAPERPGREQITVNAQADPLQVSAEFLNDVGQRDADEADRAVLRRAYEAVLAAERNQR